MLKSPTSMGEFIGGYPEDDLELTARLNQYCKQHPLIGPVYTPEADPVHNMRHSAETYNLVKLINDLVPSKENALGSELYAAIWHDISLLVCNGMGKLNHHFHSASWVSLDLHSSDLQHPNAQLLQGLFPPDVIVNPDQVLRIIEEHRRGTSLTSTADKLGLLHPEYILYRMGGYTMKPIWPFRKLLNHFNKLSSTRIIGDLHVANVYEQLCTDPNWTLKNVEKLYTGSANTYGEFLYKWLQGGDEYFAWRADFCKAD